MRPIHRVAPPPLLLAAAAILAGCAEPIESGGESYQLRGVLAPDVTEAQLEELLGIVASHDGDLAVNEEADPPTFVAAGMHDEECQGAWEQIAQKPYVVELSECLSDAEA